METINTFSTYTMYGLGELQTQGTLPTRSMGGAGVAQRNAASINLLNPASYSMALQKGVLFNFGLESNTTLSSQKSSGDNLSSSYTSANFHDIALQLPLASGIGLGFSLAPYSSVGYYQNSEEIMPTIGHISTVYTGSGDVTEVKLGVGWRVAKKLSIGFAAQYYWGDIDRYFTKSITTVTGAGTLLSTSGVDIISVSKFKGQAGVQWSPISNRRHAMTIGGTYDVGGDLSPRRARVITSTDGAVDDVYAQSDTTTMSMVLPRQTSIGFNYSSPKWVIVADYTFQNWQDYNDDIEFTESGMDVAYTNVGTLKFGLEYTPRRADARKYGNRISYRAGARLGGYQYTFGGEKLSQLNVSAGVGLPLNVVGITKVDVGLEWGSLGTTKSVQVDGATIGLIKQNQIKFSLGFTMFGDDYWFQRQEIN